MAGAVQMGSYSHDKAAGVHLRQFVGKAQEHRASFDVAAGVLETWQVALSPPHLFDVERDVVEVLGVDLHLLEGFESGFGLAHVSLLFVLLLPPLSLSGLSQDA